jgi:hypothetical protein
MFEMGKLKKSTGRIAKEMTGSYVEEPPCRGNRKSRLGEAASARRLSKEE